MTGKKKCAFISIILLILSAVVLFIYFYYFHSRVRWGNVVTTSVGSVQGIISTSRDGREFYSYLKVPYAQSPVGKLRFSTPQPVEQWTGTRDGSQYGDICAQYLLFQGKFDGKEDCLFLNVHVPKLDADHSPLPVLVLIHGGSFVAGSALEMRPDYLIDEDVIVVNINYRVGVLGFLTTGDKNIRGNMGLKDQAMALKFVKKNIEYFGGNPNRITIMGLSAGAASVHYLTLSEMTRGLFSKAVSMGGVAILPWAFAPITTAIERTKNLGRKLNCPVDNHAKLTECLRNVDVEKLLSIFGEDMTEMALFAPHNLQNAKYITPTVERVDDDEAFLTQSPYDVVSQGRAHRVPWMGTVVKDEGLLTSLAFYKDPSSLDVVESNFDKCVQNSFSLPLFLSQRKADDVSRKIREFYFPRGGPYLSREQRIAKYTEMYSDGHFLVGISEIAAAQRKFSPVYMIYYNWTKGPSYAYLMSGEEQGKARNYGIAHGEDGAMIFRIWPSLEVPKKENDPNYKLSKDLIKLFVSFAKDEKTLNFRGTQFSPTGRSGDLMYLRVDDNVKMIQEPFLTRTNFWKSVNYTQYYSSAN